MKPTKTGHPQAKVWKGYPFEGVKDNRIEDMEAVRDQNGTLWSCWKAESWRERFSFLIFGRAWVGVMSERQPPVSLAVERNIFEPTG